ncbi:MAG: metallopeptidase TldD-related protein [Phormidesmis sp.]
MTLVSSESSLSPVEQTEQSDQSSDAGRDRSPHETVFNRITEAISHQTQQPFTLSLAAEDSQFTRFNGAKVRQTGQVRDGQLRLTLMDAEHTTSASLPFVGEFATDWPVVSQTLDLLLAELHQLPVDPYVVLPSEAEQARSREVRSGKLLAAAAVAQTLIEPVKSLDFSGLYAGGISYRAYSDSAGKRHWFEAPSFTLDYSLFGYSAGKGNAVKGTLAGDQWNPSAYEQNINATQQQLALLDRPVKTIAKGSYRTYLAPAAVADLLDTIVWGGGLGEAALRQGNSAFNKLEKGDVALSKKFSLSENFQRIGVPKFNTSGAIAPTQLSVIQNGQWQNALVNARSAKEYGKPSNAANISETMRAPIVAPGTLHEDEILSRLGTGLYLSNLHYLNWSDRTAGRITGMTRYACFWVEDGKIVAPIENLRFDDNLYRFLGEGLIDLTQNQTFLPAVDTYDRRSLGGMWMPGMLIDQFRYTL